MQNEIQHGPYRKQRIDPLPGMVRRVDKALKEAKPVLGNVVNSLKKYQHFPKKFHSKTVKNSKHFTEEIKNLKIADDEVLVSFDVKSFLLKRP